MKDLNEIINLENYPINDTGSIKYRELTNYTRKQLNEDGCCVLPNFIKPDSIRRMKNEVDKNLSKIYFTNDKHNPYFTKEDETLPEDHPKRIFSVRQSGYLNSNELKPDILKLHKEFKVNKYQKMKSSLKFCVIAAGEFDLYIAEPRAYEWDIAAGHAILEHAGGTLKDFNGNEIEYGKADFKNPSLILRGKHIS